MVKLVEDNIMFSLCIQSVLLILDDSSSIILCEYSSRTAATFVSQASQVLQCFHNRRTHMFDHKTQYCISLVWLARMLTFVMTHVAWDEAG